MDMKIAVAAPKVTEQMILESILREDYFTAAEGVKGGYSNFFPSPDHARMTFCVLILKNGYMVEGMSACASPENFSAELGKKYAKEDAMKKIWSLLGYELRTKLSLLGQASPPRSGFYPKAPGVTDLINLPFTTYVANRVVHATPMTRGAYNAFRGWPLVEGENPDDDGYLTRTAAKGTDNVPCMDGYVSWLPTYQFEKDFKAGIVLKETNFLERLVTEFAELTEKLTKLNSFIGSDAFKKLPPDDQFDLNSQSNVMGTLAKVLQRRLTRLQANA